MNTNIKNIQENIIFLNTNHYYKLKASIIKINPSITNK